jgi:hypothetical protein
MFCGQKVRDKTETKLYFFTPKGTRAKKETGDRRKGDRRRIGNGLWWDSGTNG